MIDTFFTRVYYSEILILAISIIKDCDTIFEKHVVPKKGGTINIDYETQYLINSIIVSAGNIKKLFYPEKNRRKNEAAALHITRIERGQQLESLLKMSNIEHLLNVKARNGVEHFDERIDKLALKQYKKQIKGSLVLYNMTISSKRVIPPLLPNKFEHLKAYYLKVYVIDEKTAYIDNKSLNLDKLKEEAVHLKNIVSKILGEEPLGGSMIIIP